MSTENTGSWWLKLSAALFALFVINLLVGKASIAFGFKAPLQVSDVSEFLLMFCAAICFVIGMLQRESAVAKGQS